MHLLAADGLRVHCCSAILRVEGILGHLGHFQLGGGLVRLGCYDLLVARRAHVLVLGVLVHVVRVVSLVARFIAYLLSLLVLDDLSALFNKHQVILIRLVLWLCLVIPTTILVSYNLLQHLHLILNSI